MEFKKLQIDSLIPASYNRRKKLKPGDSEFKKIKNSITEFGYVDPVIVNKDLTVIGGHQRISVLKTLGYTEIDCVIIDIDKTKEKALNIALNKISGEWNKELLAELIKDLQSFDYDISFTGFEPPEIDQLFNDVHSKEIKEDDFDVEEALKEPAVTQKGDVWLLGRHRLVCGDSTDPEVYHILMDGRKTNLVVTDPPYNVNYSAQAGSIKNDNLKDDEFYNFLLKAFTNMVESMEKDASIEKKITHGGNPVLRWMMDNIYVKTDPAGNIKPDKEKSTERIDGAVALIMALDRAIRNENKISVYDERGILII